ncbi:MAG: sugar transferase [Pyramidobacter sp.]|nr:sugar transferase [Pyramidobacter sp.]
MNGFMKKFRKTVMFVFKILLVVAAVGLYVGTFKMFYEVPRLLFKDNYVIGVIHFLVFVTLSVSYNAYAIGMLRLRELIYSYALAIVLANFTGWAQLSLMLHHFISLPPMLLLTAAQMASGVLIYIAGNAIYFKLRPPRAALAILANPEDDRRVLKKFLKESRRYRIAAYCHETDGWERIARAIDGQPLVLMFGHGSHDMRVRVIRYCYETNKRLLMIPNVDEIFVQCADRCQIDDIPAFLFRNRQMTSEQRIIKRLVDIVGSAAGLIVLSPVMLITAAAIRIHDGGPVIFRQTRLTQGGRTFQLMKFRSMVVDAEKRGPELATSLDSRITPVGRWIRMLRIDELPQLFNILKGDMSIVGPRPERPELTEEYCRTYPEFRYRLKVKAGLTGYAQVFGRYNTLFEDKVKLDLLYIQHFSLIFDFYIMISTIKVLFMPSSTAGVDEEQ